MVYIHHIWYWASNNPLHLRRTYWEFIIMPCTMLLQGIRGEQSYLPCNIRIDTPQFPACYPLIISNSASSYPLPRGLYWYRYTIRRKCAVSSFNIQYVDNILDLFYSHSPFKLSLGDKDLVKIKIQLQEIHIGCIWKYLLKLATKNDFDSYTASVWSILNTEDKTRCPESRCWFVLEKSQQVADGNFQWSLPGHPGSLDDWW